MVRIEKGDITAMDVAVIVNAANAQLQAGGGVCGAIFKKAGLLELQHECNLTVARFSETKSLPVGSSWMTFGYGFGKEIIHSIGPIYQDGLHGEADLLRKAYSTAMDIVVKTLSKSVAFPFISSGIYGYPKSEAASIALSVLCEYAMNYPEIDIVMCCFGDDDYNLFVSKIIAM
jgi:O-acetyl-ADP-ribose deacetylase